MEINSPEELIKSLPLGLIGWYDFDKNEKVLYIGEGEDSFSSFFTERGFNTDLVSPEEISEEWAERKSKEYGLIFSVSLIEKVRDICGFLGLLKKALKSEGHLLLGVNNRLGLKYFCGDRDPYTGNSFDGIEGYADAADTRDNGRCYSRSELKKILKNAGWENFKFYSVLPDLLSPSLLFAEDYLPNEDLSNRVFPCYNDPDSVFMKEQSLYPVLVEEGLFHGMANAYLIECTDSGTLSNVCQVTASLDRGRENALFTVIKDDGFVEKRAAYPEGQGRLFRISEHDAELRARGIKIVDSSYADGRYTMPFIKAEVAQAYLKELLYIDKDRFLSEMDRFRDIVLSSSEIKTMEDGTEVFLKGYFDLVPLNCFFADGDFVFFDQEFCVENLPVKVMELRLVASFYFGDPKAGKVIPPEVLYERFGLTAELSRWQRMEWDILGRILNSGILREHYSLRRTDDGRIRKRRRSIDRRFINIFEGIEGKKLFLFGSGKYADRFLDLYGNDFSVSGFLDNADEKTGTKKRKIEIFKPEILSGLKSGTYKVMICMKDYSAAARQLEEMGIRDYSVYDPNRYYETRPRTSIKVVKEESGSKADEEKAADYHCHIGYCAGAFDMFHIGHLNLLRRAKERCDYLIVGVMSDERMYNLKKKYPVIPCHERMQVVAGCRYVDQVEELPADRAGIMDAWNMFHYDCMFSGDDHAEDPGWLAERERLRERGSDIVFVSYTKEQSSSAIREKMSQ